MGRGEFIKTERFKEKIVLSKSSESKNLFETIFYYLDTPAVVVDEAGLLIHANYTFANLLGVSPKLISYNRYFIDFVSSTVKQELIELFCKLRVNNNKPDELETRLVDKAGNEKKVAFALNKIPESSLYLITFTEKSNKIQSATDIKSKTDELENLFLLFSHNLKSPIVSIQGYTNLLVENHSTHRQEEIKYYLERILKNSTRLEKMVHDLIEFSKSAKQINTREMVSLNDILMNVCIECHIQIKSKDIKINIPKQLPEVLGDNDSLNTVFINLIDNAIKYIDINKKSEIEIGWEGKKRFYVFWIKDNGIGVAEDYQENVFNLFHRAEAPNHIEGTGVGLAIVKRIVENHGGLVRMSSKIGEGTTVYFTLPKLIE